MNDDIFYVNLRDISDCIVKLRDCFTAGYTLPQFCIDNDIKKPLIVGVNKSQIAFMWELHVQFVCDMRINPQFALFEGKSEKVYTHNNGIVEGLSLKNLSEIIEDSFDKVLFLNTSRFNPPINNAIYLDELVKSFFVRAYVEIPLLNFMQYYSGVKLILMNFPSPVDYEGGVEFNKQLDNIVVLRKKLAESKNNNVKTAFDKFGYTNKEVSEIVGDWRSVINSDGSVSLEVNDNEFVNIENGRRVVAYQPEKYKNKIYFIGASHHLGMGTPYDKTIESYLQKNVE
ncbi:MAG: hypothetical protein IK062_01245 [Selenomonadaceae bacterium]|nr:hypothetical protein [Selenomonadaceae bacterium]